jgi:hypothetical protein
MARRKTGANGASPTPEQVTYLAGILDSNPKGLRNISGIGYVGIAPTKDWPTYMATTYGGEAKMFTSSNSKVFWGWDVPLQRKLELLRLIRERGASHLDADTLEKVEVKLSKAVQNEKYA